MSAGDWRDALSFEPVGSHTQNSSLSSAVTLTAPTGATKIMMQAQTQNVRFVLDGSTPTSSKGFQLKAGDPAVVVPLGNSTSIKVIQEASSGVLDYQWGS